MTNTKSSRLEGLDLARFIAFAGMVIVNFSVVIGVKPDTSLAWQFTEALQGRAAASFVVLAGLGLGLGASGIAFGQSLSVTLRRSVFLLCIGLVNSLIFDADILHYYAFYFLFAAFFIPLASRWIWSAIVLLNVAFVVMILTLDYDAGWNWDTYTYEGFWTVTGFIRNLFFNGWHPVIPWLSFMLLGLILARAPLSDRRVQVRIGLIGLVCVTIAEGVSWGLRSLVMTTDPELAELLTTAPVPPMPLYILAGSGTAMVLCSLCLTLAPIATRLGLIAMCAPAGRQTLTLYIGHILVGMGCLEALQLIESEASAQSALTWSFAFIACAVIYAYAWSRVFKRGPIEALMRQTAG